MKGQRIRSKILAVLAQLPYEVTTLYIPLEEIVSKYFYARAGTYNFRRLMVVRRVWRVQNGVTH
jgi:hypothetical protein